MVQFDEAETLLDRHGRAIKVKPDSAVDPITIDYDEQGGVKTVTQGDTKQTFAYDEKLRLQSRTDATGNALVYGYDAADRIATVTVPDDVAGDSVFRYTYDADGGTKSVTTPEGKVHAFTRTETGREQTYTPAGQSTKYAQDYFGNRELKSRTVPTGASTAYTYTDGGSAQVQAES